MRKVIYPENHQYLRKGKGQEVYPERTVGKPGGAEGIEAVLVSFQNEAKACHKTMPQTGLETTEIYFLTVLEARSLKLGCQHGWVLMRTLFLACE